ncbi:hypothetical protein Ctob_006729 [Chrysochromulina tobinii]|uniref:Uncharacterized protein n=1 Tax=Chrysochromulina tobinii TaxID=1460289 RepID=A0A0M0JTF9_9EUKA|nr:hypothetical protein Ctob_006729 [Chrysochromulina tobinii]|eukprot:KOO29597.1 hypothetical protein Ctob_006729 [Chrysochromulina sp. CCMP291]
MLLPLLEAALLLVMQLGIYLTLSSITSLPAEVVVTRMTSRMRATHGYLVRVLLLQWPGLLHRAMMRVRCEARADEESDGAADGQPWWRSRTTCCTTIGFASCSRYPLPN